MTALSGPKITYKLEVSKVKKQTETTWRKLSTSRKVAFKEANFISPETYESMCIMHAYSSSFSYYTTKEAFQPLE